MIRQFIRPVLIFSFALMHLQVVAEDRIFDVPLVAFVHYPFHLEDDSLYSDSPVKRAYIQNKTLILPIYETKKISNNRDLNYALDRFLENYVKLTKKNDGQLDSIPIFTLDFEYIENYEKGKETGYTATILTPSTIPELVNNHYISGVISCTKEGRTFLFFLQDLNSHVFESAILKYCEKSSENAIINLIFEGTEPKDIIETFFSVIIERPDVVPARLRINISKP